MLKSGLKSAAFSAAFLLTSAIPAFADDAAAPPQDCTLYSVGTYDLVDDGNGHLAVSMNVNEKDVNMVIDIAGFMSGVTPKTARALRVRPYHMGVPLSYDEKGRELTDLVGVRSMKIGVFTVPNIDLIVGRGEYDNPDMNGKVGWDMLHNFDIDLDFTRKKLTLFGQVHCPGQVIWWKQGAYHKVEFRVDDQNHIRLPAILDGKPIEIQLDTAHTTNDVRDSIVSQSFGLSKDDASIKDDVVVSADGSKTPIRALHFNTLKIGDLEWNDPVFNVVPDTLWRAHVTQHSMMFQDEFASASNHTAPLTIGLAALMKEFDHVYIAYKEHVLYLTTKDEMNGGVNKTATAQ